MNLRMNKGYILVEKLEEKVQNQFGILIPSKEDEKHGIGIVRATHPDCEYKLDEKVIFNIYMMTEIYIAGEKRGILDTDNVWATLLED